MENSLRCLTALTRMKLRALLNVTLNAGGNWAIDFSAIEGLTLNIIQKGDCWLSIDGYDEQLYLRTGDCFLLTGGRNFTLATDLSLKKRILPEQLFSNMENGVIEWQGGGDVIIVATIFRFEGHLPQVMFGRLPP
ncbi:hypothetical protein AAKU61_003884 [Undibacterium sp. GrIS 1.2]